MSFSRSHFFVCTDVDLDLSKNDLSGTIPSHLGKLTELRKLQSNHVAVDLSKAARLTFITSLFRILIA
jgi:hypothetical protein